MILRPGLRLDLMLFAVPVHHDHPRHSDLQGILPFTIA